MIYLLTGPIRSGKTTALRNWCSHMDVEGILTPDGPEGRYFLDLTANDSYHMEALDSETSVEVGRFRFSEASFERAKKSLLRPPKAKYKIIDEVGKLEVRAEGFHDVLLTIVRDGLYLEHLILVVREELLAEVQQKFTLAAAQVIGKSDLADLC